MAIWRSYRYAHTILDGMLTALSEYFDYAATYLAWIIDAFNIPGIVITAISSYYFFRLQLHSLFGQLSYLLNGRLHYGGNHNTTNSNDNYFIDVHQ